MATENSNITDKGLKWIQRRISIRNQCIRELLAEFLGTLFLILVGESGGAMQTLSRNKSGDIVSTNLAWGFGVFFAILMAGPVSGGHFNPSITITWALFGKLRWKKVIPYCTAQVAGAFCGAGLVYSIYQDAINAFDGGIRQIDGDNGTAGIFSTYPAQHLTAGTAFVDQIIGTGCLVIAVLAATDPKNGLPTFLVPFAVAFYVATNGYAFTYNAGGAINPARDLGPRIFTAIAGWGSEVFSYRNYTWFWMPIIGPILGGIIGALIYHVFIAFHHPNNADTTGVPSAQTLGELLNDNPAVRQIYLSQASIDLLENLGKRQSEQPLMKI